MNFETTRHKQMLETRWQDRYQGSSVKYTNTDRMFLLHEVEQRAAFLYDVMNTQRSPNEEVDRLYKLANERLEESVMWFTKAIRRG